MKMTSFRSLCLVAVPLSLTWVACSFPEHEFNDERYERLKSGGSTAGTAGTSTTGGAGGSTGGSTTGGAGGKAGGTGGSTGGSTTGGAGGEPAGGAGGDAGAGGDPTGGTTGGGGGGTTGGTGGMATGGGGTTGTGGGGTGGGGTGGGGTGGTGGAGGGGVMNGPCTGNNQCINGQICSNVNLQTEKITCATPNASAAGDLGATCASNSACKSKFCDIAGSNTCLAGCNASSDCTGGSTCVQYLTSTPFTLCMKPCTKNEDCPANAGGTKTCFLHEDTVNDDLAFACDFLGATPAMNPKIKTFPQEMLATDFCDTGVNLQTTLMMVTKSYCSKTCATNADCGGTVLPNCKAINAQKPSGGSTAFKACTP